MKRKWLPHYEFMQKLIRHSQLLLERVAEARTRHDLETKLKAYEQQYGMNSETFHAQFLTGALGDSEDYMEWASFYEMLHAS